MRGSSVRPLLPEFRWNSVDGRPKVEFRMQLFFKILITSQIIWIQRLKLLISTWPSCYGWVLAVQGTSSSRSSMDSCILFYNHPNRIVGSLGALKGQVQPKLRSVVPRSSATTTFRSPLHPDRNKAPDGMTIPGFGPLKKCQQKCVVFFCRSKKVTLVLNISELFFLTQTEVLQPQKKSDATESHPVFSSKNDLFACFASGGWDGNRASSKVPSKASPKPSISTWIGRFKVLVCSKGVLSLILCSFHMTWKITWNLLGWFLCVLRVDLKKYTKKKLEKDLGPAWRPKKYQGLVAGLQLLGVKPNPKAMKLGDLKCSGFVSGLFQSEQMVLRHDRCFRHELFIFLWALSQAFNMPIKGSKFGSKTQAMVKLNRDHLEGPHGNDFLSPQFPGPVQRPSSKPWDGDVVEVTDFQTRGSIKIQLFTSDELNNHLYEICFILETMACRVSSLRLRSKLQHCGTCEKSHVLQVMTCVADHCSSCVATIPNNSTDLGMCDSSQNQPLSFSSCFFVFFPQKVQVSSWTSKERKVGATPNPARMNLKSIVSWRHCPVATLTPPAHPV